MKKTKLILSFVVVAFANVCVMTGCSKEQTTNQTTTLEESSKNSLDISNERNPYDFCGRIHNELLDYVITNNPRPSYQDIYSLSQEYLYNQYGVSTKLTFNDINNDYNSVADYILGAFINDTSSSAILNREILTDAFNTLVNYSKSIISSNLLPSPKEYANYLIEQEDRFVEKIKTEGISPEKVSQYEIALGAFAVARYSYSYWFTVVNDSNNAWNFVKKNTKRQDGEDPKPGFWKKLWNGVCEVVGTVAEVVVKAVVTPIVDAGGFMYGAATHSYHTPGEEGFGFNGSSWLSNGIHVAGECSGSIWD